MAYDENSRCTVFFGGYDYFAGACGETWTYFNQTPALFLSAGTGCSGVSGVPSLGVFPGSLPWLGETLGLVVKGLPSGPQKAVFGILGNSKTTWGFLVNLPLNLAPFGFPGCFFYVSQDLLVPLQVSNGRSMWSIRIPSSPFLVGMGFFSQVMALEPGSRGWVLSVSNMAEARIGMK